MYIPPYSKDAVNSSSNRSINNVPLNEEQSDDHLKHGEQNTGLKF